MSKFYAVKNGIIPGIYISWAECKKQINGYSGAIHKSFATRQEAINYLKCVKSEILIKNETDYQTLSNSNNIVFIYTDGSERKSVNHKGSGAYCKYLDKEYFMSLSCSKSLLETYNIVEYMEKLSNPTMEFLAVSEVLIRLLQINHVFSKDERLTFIILPDYIGCREWLTGDWQSDTPYIKAIRDLSLNVIYNLSKRGIDIFIGHIEGHSSGFWYSHGNNMADIAAKNIEDFDNFSLLTQELSTIFN